MKSVKGIIMVILALICVISGFVSISSFLSKKQDEAAYENLRESVHTPLETTVVETEPLTELSEEMTTVVENTESVEHTIIPEGIKNLMEQNSNVVGWITIDDTNIDYPIVQNKDDNEYFLHRDINGEKNSAGSIYLDSNHEMNEIGLHVIYGHHMKNGTMFKDIVKFRNSDYMQQHQNIKVWTNEKELTLKPVYCYAGAADGSYRNFFDSTSELQEFLKEKTGEDVSSDNVFVFITCSYGSADERTYLICEEEG